jgi:hypothetical protein
MDFNCRYHREYRSFQKELGSAFLGFLRRRGIDGAGCGLLFHRGHGSYVNNSDGRQFARDSGPGTLTASLAGLWLFF